MARTSPAPNIPPIPGMCPGVAVLAGNGDGGGAGGKGGKNGKGKKGAGTDDGDEDASGDGENGGCAEGDPICPVTGRMFCEIFDFGFAGPLPLRWVRSYSSRAGDNATELGHGWSHSFGWRLLVKRRSAHVFDEKAKEQIFRDLPASGEPVRNGFGWSLRRDPSGMVLHAGDRILTFGPDVGGGLHYLAALSDRNGNRIELQRDARGVLIGLIDSAGRPYRVTTDGAGRIVAIAVAVERTHQQWMEVVRYAYDSAGDLVSAIDAESFEARYVYDHHLMVEHRSVSGLSYCYRYDGHTTDARCIETWGEYVGQTDPALEHPIPPRPAEGRDLRPIKGIQYRRFTYLPQERYCEVENGIGGITRYFGDEVGRGVKIINPAGGVIERHFDPRTGALVQESVPSGAVRRRDNNADGVATGFLDESGAGVVSFLGPDDRTVVRYNEHTREASYQRFDDRGNLVFEQHADATREEHELDARGLLVAHVNRQGAITRFWHDDMGNCVGIAYPDGNAERSEYDYLGRRTVHLSASGDRTEWGYDRRNEIVWKRIADRSEIRVTRDANRNPTAIEDAGRITRYEWGGMGWLIAIHTPDGATVETRYDGEGNATLHRNARGQVFRQVFDTAGRPVACQTFEGVEMTAGYDAASWVAWRETPAGRDSYARDSLGRLVGVECGDGSAIAIEHAFGGMRALDNGVVALEHEFDVVGRVVRDKQGANEASLQWAAGELARVVANLGLPVAFGRDRTGNLAQISVGNTVVEVDRPEGRDLLTFLGPSLVLRREFDSRALLVRRSLAKYDPRNPLPRAQLATTSDPGLLSWSSYTYDHACNLAREEHSDGRSIQYEVDAADRITLRRSYQQGQLVAEEALAYDRAGSPLLPGVRFDSVMRPIRVHNDELEYDAAGRLVRRLTDAGEWTYEWNALDQLIVVTAPDHVVRMDYDGRSRRMRKRVYRDDELVRSIAYYWANEALMHERDELDGSARTYIRDNDSWFLLGHVDLVNGEERPCFYLANTVGTVERAVDEHGNEVWAADTTVYGERLSTRGSTRVDAGFPGQFHDEDVGLVYNRFRWYDPRLGMYVTPDPLLLKGTLNPRDYVANPTRWIDPTGEMPGEFPAARPRPNGQPRPRTAPTSAAGLTPDYLAQPGAYATNGTATTPGWVPCPPGSLQPMVGGRSGHRAGPGEDGSLTFPRATQSAVNSAGAAYGCHSCGTMDSGYGMDPDGQQHWTCDHQPPRSNYKRGTGNGNDASSQTVRLYPQCRRCSNQQMHHQSAMSDSDRTRLGAAVLDSNRNNPPPFDNPVRY